MALGLATVGPATGSVSAAGVLHPGDASVHTKELPFSGGWRGGTVRCPVGKRAVSGGASFHRPGLEPAPGNDVRLISSGPTTDGRGWHAAGDTGETDPIVLRITVRCLPKARTGAYSVRTRDLPDGFGVRQRGSLSCGTGKRIVTGGAFWAREGRGPAPTGSNTLLRSAPTADGTRWTVEAFSYSDDDHVLRIALLCLAKAKVGRLTIRHRDFPATGHFGGTVDCPSGKRAVAGGADWYQGGTRAASSSLGNSSVTRSGRGWFATGYQTADGVVLRATVLCVPR